MSGPPTAGVCAFPFTHNSKTYYECTSAGSSGDPWCIHTSGNSWGYCSPDCIRSTACGECAGLTEAECRYLFTCFLVISDLLRVQKTCQTSLNTIPLNARHPLASCTWHPEAQMCKKSVTGLTQRQAECVQNAQNCGFAINLPSACSAFGLKMHMYGHCFFL